MTKKKFYTGKYDRVFKTILCDQDNPKMLTEFLSRLLKRKVLIIEYLRNELPINTISEKSKILDVLVKADNEFIHIELNISDPEYLHQRTFIQFCGLYTKKVEISSNYIIREKFLVYNLVYGLKKSRRTNQEEMVYYLMNDDKEKYIDNVEFHEIDMDKVMESWYNKDIKKLTEYKHLIMLDLKTKELKQLSNGDDFVEEFEDKLTKLNEDETFLNIMTVEEDRRRILNSEKEISFEEGLSKGIKQGIEQGNLEEKTRNAKRMFDKGLDISLISEITGLTMDEIKKIK